MHAGDKVKAIIISINAETKKVAVGIKESLFVDAEEVESEEEAGDEDVELAGSEVDESEDEEMVVEDEDDSDEEMEVRLSLS